ncbi:Neprilysin [Orchesella cincta]|uniref:Neprilysin n=1 Tax=Orchesella cincta TaxID=48709 RepID=A0A1D2MX40_ORCCI|nr:Neprilysin [Orchesella cincta]
MRNSSVMGRVASVAVLTAFVLLATTSTTPTLGASLLHQKSSNYNQKLEAIRELSKAAGAPQIDGSVNQEEICLTEGCLDAALDILNAINMTVDPCKDFFQYSCGRWLANNPVPPSASRWSRFNRLRDEVNNVTQEILNEEPNDQDAKPINQVKDFYKSCIDIDAIEVVGLEPLNQVITEFGGWQLLNPGVWNSSAFDWLKSVAEVRRRSLQSVILSVYVSADLKNTTRSAVYLDQPGFGLPRGVLITPENYTALITAYENYMVEVAQELGTSQTEAQLRTSAKAIIELEVAMAKISSSDEARYDIDRIYNPYALNEYQTITDGVDTEFSIVWKNYLDQVFSSSGVAITDNEFTIVNELEYIRNLIPILKGAEADTIANYIVWRLVSGLIPDTNAAMRAIVFKFQQALTGATVPSTRDVTCANAANGVFGMAIGVKYIEAVFDDDAKAEVNTLVENLRLSFKEMVTDADWMQDETKTEAIAKADAIRSFMAYPDWLENKTAVEEFYQGLELADTYFNSQLNLALYRMDKGLKGLREPTNRDEWIMYPGVVNAAYSPELNSITFPAGILQPPFFGKLRPKSQNYGGIGVVIGHEITHGFDNQGAQFDKDGNFNNWWDDVTKVEYDARAQCMSDQYSGFFAEAAGLNVNGDLTLGENIADNGGLRESYRAYQKYVEENGQEGRLPGLEHLSTNQLFFLGYANIWCESITPEGLVNQILTDPHSPAEFRVKGPVRNNAEFAAAFSCPEDENGMNPPEEDECTVW